MSAGCGVAGCGVDSTDTVVKEEEKLRDEMEKRMKLKFGNERRRHPNVRPTVKQPQEREIYISYNKKRDRDTKETENNN